MKIAVSYNKSNDNVNIDFETTNFFNFYDVVNNSVVCSEIIGTMGSKEKEELAHILLMFETDALICGSISDASVDLISDEGISIFSGCKGKSDDLVDLLLAGELFPGQNYISHFIFS